MTSATFHISGMHCANCAQIIATLLIQERGVQAADVSFTGGEARVLYDSQATSEAHLVATIEKLGYRALTQDR